MDYLFIFLPNYYSDYFSQNRSGSYYVYRGGGSSTGAGCGAFYVRANDVSSSASWPLGAALSFKLVR